MRFPGFRRLVAVGLSATLLLTVVGVAPVAACDQGCTPGYWKNHTESWVQFSSTQTLTEAGFDLTGLDASFQTATLMDALKFGGGPGVNGAAKILLRAAVASLLNAAALNFTTPTAYHFWTVAALLDGSVQITGVNEILASLDRQVMLAYAAELDYYNNLGCPCNNLGCP